MIGAVVSCCAIANKLAVIKEVQNIVLQISFENYLLYVSMIPKKEKIVLIIFVNKLILKLN